MHHSRTLNDKMNRVYERSSQVVHNNKETTFKEILDKDKTVSIHARNFETLVTEIFKTKISESLSIIQ